MVNELLGKVAIVTGGASGIGAGIVERFLAEGAQVVIADVERGRGGELAAKLGGDVIFRPADVSDPEQVAALVASAVETFGGLDVMVNNAGVSSKMHRSFLDDDLADFQRVMSVNVLGVMAGTRDAARQMAKSGGGSIINMSSIGGIQAGGGVMTYRASKAAVIMFTKSSQSNWRTTRFESTPSRRATSRHRCCRRRQPTSRPKSWRGSSARSVSRCGPTVRSSARAPPATSPRPRSIWPATGPAT